MKYESFRRVTPPCAPDLSARPVLVSRVPYRYDVDTASLASGLFCPEPTRTQQQFKDETDINTIAKNFGMTGRLPECVRMPTFADFEDVVDYQTALNAGRRASQSFMQMPATVRERFQNDPQQFLEFCSSDANRVEAISLGLIPSPPISASVPPAADPPKPA